MKKNSDYLKTYKEERLDRVFLMHTCKTLLIIMLIFSGRQVFSQNEATKWYFERRLGLDFMTNPPSPIPTSTIHAVESCASIADAAGNLLFYTNGDTVWNKNNQVMLNGTGMFGNSSTTQGVIIVKDPGNANKYYVFTLDDLTGNKGLRYSVVDMTQGAGLGALTLKNIRLQAPSCEKMAAVRHCNGVDVWLLSHDRGTNAFRCLRIGPAGIDTLNPVISNIGPVITHSYTTVGQMKISPDGKKVGMAVHDVIAIGYNGTPRPVEIFDFDATTGIVSNQISLQSFLGSYGCEFSPDGTKFYVSNSQSFAGIFSPTPIYYMFQWDLCAGSASAVAASIYTISIPANTGKADQMQLAKDGKIYVGKSWGNLSIINSPNLAGAACNYSDAAITFTVNSPGTLGWFGLPNFVASLLRPSPPPFTYSTTCSVVSFSSPVMQNTLSPSCSFANNPVISRSWNFGDPGSASANTSGLSDPVHTFTGPGTYTVKLALNYACATDTIRLPVTVGAVSCSVAGMFTVCPKEKRIYTASGATSYSWSTGAITSTVALTTSVNTIYSVTAIGPAPDFCKTVKTFQVIVDKCTGISSEEISEVYFKIYPNPVRGALNIDSDKEVNVCIQNMYGQLILEQSFGAGSHQVDMSAYAPGIYFVSAGMSGVTRTTRIVKTE